MLNRPSSCFSCRLHQEKIAIGFSHPEGTGASSVYVCAESLGEHEAGEGLPLRPNAPAGSIFAQVIRRYGIDRSRLLIGNVLWCRPGVRNWLEGAPYEYEAIESCRQYTDKLIETRKPKAILALGGIATRTLTGMTGHNLGIKMIRGFILDSRYGIPCIPSYHPSYILRGSKTRSKETGGKTEKAEGGPSLMGVLGRDLQLALAIAQSGPPTRPQVNYIAADRDLAEKFYQECLSNPYLPIGADIETPESWKSSADESEIDKGLIDITQIQFSLRKYEGVVFPGFDCEWSKDYSKRILALPNKKLGHNWVSFDAPILMSHGMSINGVQEDTMWLFHHLQADLPKGLQYVTSFYSPEMGPWKHLAKMGGLGQEFNSESEFVKYGGADVDSLHRIYEPMRRELESRGMVTSYERHILELRGVLNGASAEGFPVDPEEQDKLATTIKSQQSLLELEVKKLVPQELQPLKTTHKEGLKKVPKEIQKILEESGDKDCVTLASGEIYIRREFSVMDKTTLEEQKVLRWAKLEDFNIASSKQIINWINYKRKEEIDKRLAKGQSAKDAERLAKYKVPVVLSKLKELKETTGQRELERLAEKTGDRLLEMVLEYRGLDKIRGTFLEGAWRGGKDRKVHPEFLYAPATGQLSSRNPNSQQGPKNGDLAQAFRLCVKAHEGKWIVEADKTAYHAQTLAYHALDANYLRISKIDIHSFVTAHRLKLPERDKLLEMTDSELKEFLNWHKKQKTVYGDGLTFKEIRDQKSKKCILGIGFKQQARSLFQQNPEAYSSEKEVQSFIDLLKDLFKPVFKWQDEISALAHKQGWLQNQYGQLRRFYDVYRWDHKKWNKQKDTYGDWASGDDLEASVAFLPASSAFSELREEMLSLAGYASYPDVSGVRIGEDLLTKYGFCNQIHDSLIFHVEDKLLDKCIEDVSREMLRPSAVLKNSLCPDGLQVGIGVAVGRNWAKWTPENPAGLKEL